MKIVNLPDHLRQLRDGLLTGLVERDIAIRLALLATLAGEHLLLLGPPGTAKSMVAQRLALVLRDSTYFERLLTRFSVPEELFGPLSIRGLEEDRYERLTAGYLPSATVAFLDEIFKANSAILNSLLTLLNERQFDNGATRVKTPLIAVIGASNELPDGPELGALFDRFLLRLEVQPVSKEGFDQLLQLRGSDGPDLPQGCLLSHEELCAVQAAAEHVVVTDDLLAALRDLRTFCAAEQIAVSDRRWRKIVKLLQVSALTNGRKDVSIWDLWLVQFCVGVGADQQDKVAAWYADKVGATATMDPANLTRIITIHEARLQRAQADRIQKRDESARPLFVGPDGRDTVSTVEKRQKSRNNDKLFLAPDGAAADYYMQKPIRDRSNAGAGYTPTALDSLFVAPHSQFLHWAGRGAYLADKSNWLLEEGPLAPAMEPARFAEAEIAAWRTELSQFNLEIDAYLKQVADLMASHEDELSRHVWVLPSIAVPGRKRLEETQGVAQAIQRRLGALVRGVDQLPRKLPFTTALDAAPRSETKPVVARRLPR